jgi:hypothetical protein
VLSRVTLANFDQVYACYDRLARDQCAKRGGEYQEFAWQPYRLLEAYAMGIRAMESGSIVHTSEWGRQQGATTTAIALVLACDQIAMLTTNKFQAWCASQIIANFSLKERIEDIHSKVWWESSVRQRVHRLSGVKLIVVDSHCPHAAQCKEAIEFIRIIGCAVLVLPPRA